MTSNMSSHAIFDFGGVICSWDSIADVFEGMFTMAGMPGKISRELIISLKNHENKEGGNNFDEQVKWLFRQVGEDVDQLVIEECKQCLAEAMKSIGLRMNPGVDRLIRHLHSKGIPMAIATNSTAGQQKFLVESFRGFDESYFSHTVCAADDPEVANNKPSPDVYLICANRFPTRPQSLQSCVVFEDSLVGIKGAIAAGMKSVLIDDNRGHNYDSIADNITVIVDSFEDFLPESVGFPAYEP